MVERTTNRDPKAPERGLRFGLSQETFDRWWESAITVDDGEKFVHVYQGNMLGARFVCAIDLLKLNHPLTADIIVQAYLAAAEIPDEHLKNHIHRISAQALYDDPSVQWLLDQVQYRSDRAARERIARRMSRRLERLYDETENPESLRDVGLQKVIMEGSSRFLLLQSREKQADDMRRDKIAMQKAIAQGKMSEGETHKIPTLEEAKHFLHMLRDHFGAAEFSKILGDVTPHKLK